MKIEEINIGTRATLRNRPGTVMWMSRGNWRPLLRIKLDCEEYKNGTFCYPQELEPLECMDAATERDRHTGIGTQAHDQQAENER